MTQRTYNAIQALMEMGTFTREDVSAQGISMQTLRRYTQLVSVQVIDRNENVVVEREPISVNDVLEILNSDFGYGWDDCIGEPDGSYSYAFENGTFYQMRWQRFYEYHYEYSIDGIYE